MASTRRGFLKAAGAAGGLLAFGPASANAAPAGDDPWARVPVILGRITPPSFPDRVFDIRS